MLFVLKEDAREDDDDDDFDDSEKGRGRRRRKRRGGAFSFSLFHSSILPFFLSCMSAFLSLIEAVEGTTKILKMSNACVKVPKAFSRVGETKREREKEGRKTMAKQKSQSYTSRSFLFVLRALFPSSKKRRPVRDVCSDFARMGVFSLSLVCV